MTLTEFWDALDKAVITAKLDCGTAAESCNAKCCKFKESNLEPHLALDEFMAVKKYLNDYAIPLPPQNRNQCRFLDTDDTCMVYEVRPTLCRVYFCEGDLKMKKLPEELLKLGTQYDTEHPDDALNARPMSSLIDEIWQVENPTVFF